MKSSIRTLWSPSAVSTLVLVACAMFFAPDASAGPVAYTIDFTTTFGLAPASGSFVYDSTLSLGSQFSSFLVTWDGFTFDLTQAANDPGGNTGDCSASVFSFLITGSDCTTHAAGQPNWAAAANSGISYEDIAFTDADAGSNNLIRLFQSVDDPSASTAFAGGTWTATATTPEPGSFMLVLVFICLLLVLKRKPRDAGAGLTAEDPRREAPSELPRRNPC